jgi:alkanesulfonate monooxygenase SsuD/methylene tetrahydromethanopterin reductase-like flavin-dependent oxidoreductase (luciferase family)
MIDNTPANPDSGRTLGILLHGSTPVNAIARLARRIEDLGFQSVWFGEDYFLAGGFSSAAIALQATSHLHVGLGIVANVVRHPAVLAMEAGTLAGAFPGRFSLGVGHGVPAWMRQMRLYPKSPLTAMRECLIGLRGLLDGQTVTMEGEYFGFREVVLRHAAVGLPILAGVVGPKSIRLAVDYANGLVVSALAGPRYVRHAKVQLTEAAKAAGHEITPQIPVYALGCIDRDTSKARAIMRNITAHYLAAMGPTDLTGSYGANEMLKEMILRGGADAVAREMPEEWLEWLGVSGTPLQCGQQIEALFEAGATSVMLGFVPQESFEQQLELAAQEILPRFQGR